MKAIVYLSHKRYKKQATDHLPKNIASFKNQCFKENQTFEKAMKNKTRVLISIKKDILDPAGVAVKKALVQQGLLDVSEVRIGKMIDITFKTTDAEKNQAALKEFATTILTNPIMEDFSIEIVDE